VMLGTKALIEKEVVLLNNLAFFLGKNIQIGEVACYRFLHGTNTVEGTEPINCSSTGEKNISYRGTQWAVLTFSHKNIIVTQPVLAKNGTEKGLIIIEALLEPIYQKIRTDWKIVIYYIVINVIIFSSIGFFRMYKLVLKPIDRMVDISEKFSPSTELSFYSGDANNEFSKLSLGLNRMVKRIREDNKVLSNTVESLAAANRELKRNKNEMIRTEKLASIGRLSAGLAHEIGNPLGIIQGYVDMLGASELTDQEKLQFSKRANSELKRIDTLIHQLLDISRKVGNEHKIIHVQQLMVEVVDSFLLQEKNRQIEITTDFNAENDRAAVVEDQLHQVFLNCLMNAADAIEESSEQVRGEIGIICENMIIEEEEHLQIKIVDNGPGVGITDLDNIFDPFFTTKEAGKGTGLGLYVSYTIMENFGGEIRLKNVDPVGAEIVIQLPCVNNVMNT